MSKSDAAAKPQTENGLNAERLNLRFLMESDISEVVAAERLSLPQDCFHWCLGADGIKSIVKQRHSEAAGTWDTRSMVIEMPVQDCKNPNQWIAWVCGAFAFELQPVGYEILYVIVHPDAPLDKIIHIISLFMRGKADRSPLRRTVTLYLRDRDEAGLRKLLPIWRSKGFESSLARDYFGQDDGWKMVYESEVPNEERDKRDGDKQFS